jgi:hypothetical protein
MATVARRVVWLTSAALFWTVSLSTSEAVAYYIFPDGFSEVRTSTASCSDTDSSPATPSSRDAIQCDRPSDVVPPEASSTALLSHFALGVCMVVIERPPAVSHLFTYIYPHTHPMPNSLEHPPKQSGVVEWFGRGSAW